VVDEAQDCSTADLYILNKLYDVGLPLVAVADPDQAIYGFRGAATHALTSLAGRLGYRNGSHGGFYEERNTLLPGGRYWDRTSDLLGVNWANVPGPPAAIGKGPGRRALFSTVERG
jgi:ATP-dependent exoDNAse (exonuclease V) beta subunit